MASRKDIYTDEQKAEVCAHVLVNVSCGRFVSRIFKEDTETENGIRLPAAGTFWRWVLEDAGEGGGELGDKLASARERGIEALLDDIALIADTPLIGEEVSLERDPDHQKELDEGGEVTDAAGEPYEGMVVKVKRGDMLQHRRLQIETRIKLAQMMKPKTYGPKLDLTSNGETLGAAEMLQAARKRAQELK